MARYALESIPVEESGQAMREAMGGLPSELKIGVISSLGARQDDQSVPALAKLLGDSDAAVARAAALALGAICNADAAKALQGAKSPEGTVAIAVTDAKLACAEAMLAGGDKKQALLLYRSLAGDEQPKHVRLAATRGMLACAGQ